MVVKSHPPPAHTVLVTIAAAGGATAAANKAASASSDDLRRRPMLDWKLMSLGNVCGRMSALLSTSTATTECRTGAKAARAGGTIAGRIGHVGGWSRKGKVGASRHHPKRGWMLGRLVSTIQIAHLSRPEQSIRSLR